MEELDEGHPEAFAEEFGLKTALMSSPVSVPMARDGKCNPDEAAWAVTVRTVTDSGESYVVEELVPRVHQGLAEGLGPETALLRRSQGISFRSTRRGALCEMAALSWRSSLGCHHEDRDGLRRTLRT